MPKRKRSENDVGGEILRLKHDLFQALKLAKGFERQRQSKRLREAKSDPKKTERLEKEVAVLKSLDLQGAAHALLCSSLLRIKPVAESPRLPNEIKAGVPKPDISEEEKSLLHNVTSALYNYPRVRESVDKAVTDVCNALEVPVPEKGGKRKKLLPEIKQAEGITDKAVTVEKASKEDAARQRRTDKPAKPKQPAADDDLDEEQQERAVSLFEKILGSSSEDEDSDAASDDDALGEKANEKDPMEITSGEEEDGDGDEFADIGLHDEEEDEEEEEDDDDDDDDDDDEESEDEIEDTGPAAQARGKISDDDASDDEAGSGDDEGSPIPRPAKTAASSTKATKSARVTDSTFMPSLMGGYVSGSESASDVDVAPAARKNRRGQRARQAIWEKKYKEQAKHLHKTAGGGKDAGWDPIRGAVDDSGKPWKRGVRTPLDHSRRKEEPERVERAPRKEEPKQTGPLHPSWEAKKKAKEAQQMAKFEGKKITFD